MKRFIIILFSLFFCFSNALAQRIAVMEFRPGTGVSQEDVTGLSSIFLTYFNPRGYTLVERSQIDRIIAEQGLQKSSITESQIIEIGKILNVSKIVVGDINVILGQYNLDARVIDVETGTIYAKEGDTFGGSSFRNTMKRIAESLSNQISQATSITSSTSSRTTGAIPFQEVEVKPSFYGGDANAFSSWVQSNLQYPEEAKKNEIQGRVVVSFKINEDGRVFDVVVLRGVNAALDKEAVRVVSSSPKWKPGEQHGKPVAVVYTFPVIFQLR